MKKTYNNPTALICTVSSSDVITASAEQVNFFDANSGDYVVYGASSWGMEG